jgi:tRNA pseudouridine55 synthase
VPPAYSALKINGQPAYKLARKGEQVNLQEREVEIKNIELVSYEWPEMIIKVDCGGGTYIRTLAEDIGKELEVGAYLSDLVRTEVKDFKIEDSISLD